MGLKIPLECEPSASHRSPTVLSKMGPGGVLRMRLSEPQLDDSQPGCLGWVVIVDLFVSFFCFVLFFHLSILTSVISESQ